jgi:hypothetical protein
VNSISATLCDTLSVPSAPSDQLGKGIASVATYPSSRQARQPSSGYLSMRPDDQKSTTLPKLIGVRPAPYPFGVMNVISVRPASVLGPRPSPNRHHFRSTAPVTGWRSQYGPSGATGYASNRLEQFVAGLVSLFKVSGMAYAGHAMSNPTRSAVPCPSQYNDLRVGGFSLVARAP